MITDVVPEVGPRAWRVWVEDPLLVKPVDLPKVALDSSCDVNVCIKGGIDANVLSLPEVYSRVFFPGNSNVNPFFTKISKKKLASGAARRNSF